MSEPKPQQSEAVLQAQARATRLAAAFAEVFGQPKSRTPAQQSVLAHLALCAGDDGNSYRFHEARDGLALVAAGIHRDGAKSLILVINRQVEIASRVREPRKAPPKTTR